MVHICNTDLVLNCCTLNPQVGMFNSTSLESIQPCWNLCAKVICSLNSTCVYRKVLINYTVE